MPTSSGGGKGQLRSDGTQFCNCDLGEQTGANQRLSGWGKLPGILLVIGIDILVDIVRIDAPPKVIRCWYPA